MSEKAVILKNHICYNSKKPVVVSDIMPRIFSGGTVEQVCWRAQKK
jgi:hypothetical protein